MRRAFFVGLPVLAVAVVVACSSSTSSSGAGPDGGGGQAGSCPCTVGNSGLQFTIGCGGSQCISLNGQAKGYRCENDGAHEDLTVCTNPGSSPPGTPGKPCVPKTCEDLKQGCGAARDGCGKDLACPVCADGTFCSEEITKIANDPTTTPPNCFKQPKHIAIYGDLQGGTFEIEVDQNVEDLAIGLIANEAMNVTLTGAYVDNVVAVYFVGNETRVTVTGVPMTKVAAARLPSATVDAGFFAQDMGCENGSSQACNPPSQVNQFFTDTLKAPVLFNKCAELKLPATMKISQGGTCP